jgi:hypothetical protein
MGHAVGLEVAVVVRGTTGSLDEREASTGLTLQRLGPPRRERYVVAHDLVVRCLPCLRALELAPRHAVLERELTLPLPQLAVLPDRPPQLLVHQPVVLVLVDLPDERVPRQDALHVDHGILEAADQVVLEALGRGVGPRSLEQVPLDPTLYPPTHS